MVILILHQYNLLPVAAFWVVNISAAAIYVCMVSKNKQVYNKQSGTTLCS